MNPLNANSNGPTRIRRAFQLASVLPSVLPSVLASVLAFQLPFVAPASAAPSVTPGKVLFDATKAEMAANADWVLDTDVNNIGTGTNGAMVVGAAACASASDGTASNNVSKRRIKSSGGMFRTVNPA